MDTITFVTFICLALVILFLVQVIRLIKNTPSNPDQSENHKNTKDGFPTHKNEISWQITGVMVDAYGSHPDGFLRVMVSVWPPNSFMSVVPKSEDVLKDAFGTYPGPQGDVVVRNGTHESLQRYDNPNGTMEFGFRKRGLQ